MMKLQIEGTKDLKLFQTVQVKECEDLFIVTGFKLERTYQQSVIVPKATCVVLTQIQKEAHGYRIGDPCLYAIDQIKF
ncbi:hypothetical protein P6P90_10960 [Ectobacillus antri]|jgi:hypothetical protein|uniref:Uncharacterized protein n=1 Tax=Ectobacillus antri TaxID=2486280 RepID=A0ABT6H575_9BACI|nr:hypothetical protein [Ectobacillus antri]MDG4657382.1 hypothetical protein [Ectobacillus antri]MDG5754487.1 hypothetical protein [Ectobacillus antri]